MIRYKTILPMVLCLMYSTSCREPFVPEVPFEETNFLVIEGYINIGEGETKFRLSRTTKVNTGVGPLYENNAVVHVESRDNAGYILTPRGNGLYTADLNLPGNREYRIRITTNNDKEYVSDFVQPVPTPAIDSVVWKLEPDGVYINLFAHGDSNNTSYYQWEYDETWQIRSAFTSYLKLQGGVLVPRSNEETVAMSLCWKSDVSPDLTLHSTASLSSNVVAAYPLVFIPLNTERLSERYHIQIRQHALSREAFDYLTLMKKNTGPLGSFSDPQPSELIGNIRCTTTDEPVVGYIGAYNTQKVAFYISRWDVPLWDHSLFCEEIPTLNHPDSLAKYFIQQNYIPTFGSRFADGGEILSVFRAADICVDCRIRGGVAIKPDFWE